MWKSSPRTPNAVNNAAATKKTINKDDASKIYTSADMKILQPKLPGYL